MDAILDSWPPELPRIPDLASMAACYGVGEAAKRIRFTDPKRNKIVRRWLPFTLLVVGAGVRTATEVALGGGDIQIALVRGVIAGAAAVYAQNVKKALQGGRGVGGSRATDTTTPPGEESK
jgi:hypothetical protein